MNRASPVEMRKALEMVNVLSEKKIILDKINKP